MECIDIGIKSYFRYDDSGNLTQASVDEFLNKLGGIAFNKSKSPVDQEINRLKNKGNYRFSYWNPQKADDLLREYVQALYSYGWSEPMVLNDLREESVHMMNRSKNWTDWSQTMEMWIYQIKHWKDNDNVTVNQNGSVLPNELFNALRLMSNLYANKLMQAMRIIFMTVLQL